MKKLFLSLLVALPVIASADTYPQYVGLYTNHWKELKDNISFFADNDFNDDRTRLVEYSFDSSPTLEVPGDWNTQSERLYYYEGWM